MTISTTEARNLLVERLGFEVVNNHVHFIGYKIVDGERKKVVKAVHPTVQWQVELWNECIRLIKESAND